MCCFENFPIGFYLSVLQSEKLNEELENPNINRKIMDSQTCLAQEPVFFPLDTHAHGCDCMLHTCNWVNLLASEADDCLQDWMKHVDISCGSCDCDF